MRRVYTSPRLSSEKSSRLRSSNDRCQRANCASRGKYYAAIGLTDNLLSNGNPLENNTIQTKLQENLALLKRSATIYKNRTNESMRQYELNANIDSLATEPEDELKGLTEKAQWVASYRVHVFMSWPKEDAEQ